VRLPRGPGSPGARPVVGHKLHVEDQILLVDDVKANNDNIVDLMRGSNLPGTKVHLSVRRAASGATDYVVCVRAPLNHVEHTQVSDSSRNASEVLRSVDTIF
jgi:C-terminal processing protease CtpA/Prc